VSTRLEAGTDPVTEADRRGTILVAIRFLVNPKEPPKPESETPDNMSAAEHRIWTELGLKLTPTKDPVLVPGQFRGGMLVTDVDLVRTPEVKRGDVILGMDKWATESIDNISFVLEHPGDQPREKRILPIYLVRNGTTFRFNFNYVRQFPSTKNQV